TVRRSRVAVLAAAAVPPPGLSACTRPAPTGDTSPIVIGADLELAGVDAPVGTTYARALQLRIDQLNAAGGIDGRRIVLDQKDNRSDPGMSVANINAFSTEPGLAGIILGACAECVEDVSKTVEDRQLPTVTLAPASGVVRPVTDHPYLSKRGPNANDSDGGLAATP